MCDYKFLQRRNFVICWQKNWSVVFYIIFCAISFRLPNVFLCMFIRHSYVHEKGIMIHHTSHTPYFQWNRKYRDCTWFYVTLRINCLALPSTGFIAVLKLHSILSVLKTDKRTGSRLQAALKYENCNMSFLGLLVCLNTHKKSSHV